MQKRYTQTWGQACTIAKKRHRKKKKSEGKRRKPITFICRACRVKHNKHAKSQTQHRRRFAMVMRESRDRRGRSRGCNYVGRLALRHCVHLAAWLFHERPKTSAGGDRGRCRLRRTERYAQFDRRYTGIENITANLLPLSLSLSLDRPLGVSPPRFFTRFPFPFSIFFFSFLFFLTFFGRNW